MNDIPEHSPAKSARRPNSKRSGFTLIELLVVIAVIGLLAAILTPATIHAIHSAKKSESALEMKQIGGALHLYLAEHDYIFPPGWGGGQGTYAQHLNPYIYNKDNRSEDNMFAGPFALPFQTVLGSSGQIVSFPISYSANPLLCPNINVSTSRVSLDQVSYHSDLIFLTDGCQNPANNNQANATFYAADNFGIWGAPPADLDDLIDIGPDTDEATSEGQIRYPKGNASCLFVDGSVRKINKGEMTARQIFVN